MKHKDYNGLLTCDLNIRPTIVPSEGTTSRNKTARFHVIQLIWALL